MRPLDVAILKPLQTILLKILGLLDVVEHQPPYKQAILTQWVSDSLKEALIESNIHIRFHSTSIYPLNFHGGDTNLMPLETYDTQVGPSSSIDTHEQTTKKEREHNMIQWCSTSRFLIVIAYRINRHNTFCTTCPIT